MSDTIDVLDENTEALPDKPETPFRVNDIEPSPGLKIGGISGGTVNSPDGDTPIIQSE